MKRLFVSAIVLSMIMSLEAQADAVGHALWCKGDTGDPTKAEDMIVKAPDGNPRGPRSAANLYQRAVDAAKAGKSGEAINWIPLCQGHNSSAQNEIIENTGQVLAELKK